MTYLTMCKTGKYASIHVTDVLIYDGECNGTRSREALTATKAEQKKCKDFGGLDSLKGSFKNGVSCRVPKDTLFSRTGSRLL